MISRWGEWGASRNADARTLMGWPNRQMTRFAEAAPYYDAALKANPRHLGALENQVAASAVGAAPA